MFKEIKKSMSRELNRYVRTMSLPIKNIDKEIGIIKMSQTEILELKIIITEIKNPLEEFKRRFYLAEQKDQQN